MVCETCNLTVETNYGSGRFCSEKCARCFSTKEKRQEINSKLRKERILKFCLFCNSSFQEKKNKRFCSRSCGTKHQMNSLKHRQLLSQKRLDSMEKGVKNGLGFKGIFTFQNQEIPFDSKLELKFLNFCVSLFDLEKIERCKERLSYVFNGRNKTFNPDFTLYLKDKTIIIVECKYENASKYFKDYEEKSFEKRRALEIFCKNKNYKMIWYTQKS